ncbi:murein L,D-transpeptidase family protein [Mesorhizobium sp. Z1-4]|uniref:L,D-transpeptidase family protein n=1 Tax=Mesorhizobium sp. Z1-4 TaxID=2448478 RepID=UPI000FD8D89A|nr:murein L,D-transpeptidase family protein [Mesorhizobium sp. Z1-4]
MVPHLARIAVIVSALALAGCNETLEDISPKAEKKLPPSLVQSMRAKGMTTTAPIMLRIFKEEGVLEVWKQKDTGRYAMATSYDICKWSGKLGPKFTEGDRQAPEGFYDIKPWQMNPKSSYHLAFNMGYPNNFDRAHGRTGSNLMVHGACSSAGCYSMSDEQVEQIYAFARDAFRGGQEAFQVQAFPFRMTAENMARYQQDPNYQFWTMLKEGYDHFEITKVPPKVDVCGRRYVFNSIPQEGSSFSPNASCPAMAQPARLQTAYQSYQLKYDAAFSAALGEPSSRRAPSPSIGGFREATQVADWSRRRARGERVTRLPPNMQPETPPVTAPPPRPAPQVAAAPQSAPATSLAEEQANSVADAAGTAVPAENPQPANAEGGEKKNPLRKLWGMFKRDQ